MISESTSPRHHCRGQYLARLTSSLFLTGIAIANLCLMISVPSAQCQSLPSPSFQHENADNKKPASDDLQISVGVFKSPIPANEIIILDIAVKNPDSKRHGMISQGPTDRDFNVRVKDSQGQPTPLTSYGKGEIGLILPTSFVSLHQSKHNKNAGIMFDPGEERHFYVWVNHLFDMTVSGDYTVGVTLYLDGRDLHGQPKKGGKVLTAETHVTVTYIEEEDVAEEQKKAMAIP